MQGHFRLVTDACPAQASEEVWEIVEAYLDTVDFPGTPMAATVGEIDARTYDGVKIVQRERVFIELEGRRLAREERERLREERRARRGR